MIFTINAIKQTTQKSKTKFTYSTNQNLDFEYYTYYNFR